MWIKSFITYKICIMYIHTSYIHMCTFRIPMLSQDIGTTLLMGHVSRDKQRRIRMESHFMTIKSPSVLYASQMCNFIFSINPYPYFLWLSNFFLLLVLVSS